MVCIEKTAGSGRLRDAKSYEGSTLVGSYLIVSIANQCPVISWGRWNRYTKYVAHFKIIWSFPLGERQWSLVMWWWNKWSLINPFKLSLCFKDLLSVIRMTHMDDSSGVLSRFIIWLEWSWFLIDLFLEKNYRMAANALIPYLYVC